MRGAGDLGLGAGGQPSLAELRKSLDAHQVSAVELARAYLSRIAASSDLNAFLHIDEPLTLAQAAEADRRLASGETTPLLGIPVAHKDIFVTRGWRSTAGSKMLAHYTSPFDAAVVEKLRAAGMVCLGKLNCDEFAMGSSNENSAFGPVRNPWDRERVPGGSSGASAAVVAAGLSPAATGTDTGGSLRQPAAMCGVTAIKPTYGRVSRYGMVAFASSLDQGGPMAQSAADCALLLAAMAGFDERDSTSIDRAADDYSALPPADGLRIGVPREFFGEGLAGDVAAAVQAALREFEKLGATLVDITLPRTQLSIPAYYVIAPAEASSNLSRFDGVRYGHRAADYGDLTEMIERSRAEGFGAEVKRRIFTGTFVLSHGYYDAYYLQAQKVRRLIAQDFQDAFRSCDLILGPVAPTTAWKLGDKSKDPVAMYLEDIFTLGVSLAGLPGMSVPCGLGKGDLPVGLQIIGNYFNEARMLGAAHHFQLATDWHVRRPPGAAA
ncbi:MAG: Asp-tRNA(Asn)/Glu-tRNA(Gln) amidotransferase subunit GatA [Betaproteobacteria bacterium]|nr:Asp-tRNA(Asn)/Glu-tRNA(Gln) amidotransferase subunit GatA [Betaproteobacteria bacterium]